MLPLSSLSNLLVIKCARPASFQVHDPLRPMTENVGNKLSQLGNLDGDGFFSPRANNRLELQRTHTSYTHVAKAFDRGEVTRTAPLSRQPCINDPVAETVRQGISQQTR